MKRYVVTCMLCLANFMFYCMRLNLNIAMTKMTEIVRTAQCNTTDVQQSNKSSIIISKNISGLQTHTIPTYEWDEFTQQMILGAFYCGYAVMPIPGGWLAGKIGGKRMVGFAVIWSSLMTALIPWAAGVSVRLLITLRILDGLVQGTANPSIYVILGKWTVPHERSVMVSISSSGLTLGAVGSSYISGWICSSYEIGGWPTSFYTYSIGGLLWTAVWVMIVHEAPSVDPDISEDELRYLNSYIIQPPDESKNISVPWWDIFTSSAVWAVIGAYIAFDFGMYMIITETPLFISTILGFNVLTTGFLISIPSIIRFPVIILSAMCSDFIIRREFLSILNTRKALAILEFGISGVCLVAIGYVGDSIVSFMVLITITFCAISLSTSCIMANVMDISTRYAGIINGVMSTFSNSTGFIGPAVLGLLIEGNNTFDRWSYLFIITAGVQLTGMLVFLTWAKGEEQKWSRHSQVEYNEMTNLITPSTIIEETNTSTNNKSNKQERNYCMKKTKL